MAHIDKETVERWRNWASIWLGINTELTPLSITDGADAWIVAHRCGIVPAAYADPTTMDVHIQTALKSIFPNAVFKDKKRY